jgi:plastocyanin
MAATLARHLIPAALIAVVAAASVLVAGLVLAPRVAAGDPCYHGFDIPARTEATESQIKVGPCFFAPTVAHVGVGDTVTFFNGEGFIHLITGANAEWGSRDAELAPESQVSFTFDKPGVYPYACALHRGMSGVIVVGDAASARGAAPAVISGGTAGADDAAGAGSAGVDATVPASAPAAPGLAAAALFGVVAGAGGVWVIARRRYLSPQP